MYPFRTAVVACADRSIFPFLIGLLLSLRGLNRERHAVHVIDVGLTPAQRDHAASLCDGVASVDDDLVVRPHPKIVENLEEKLPFWRAQFCRPYLRDYFPGYAGYIHIDADIWAQRLDVFDAATVEMERGRVVIVPEADAAYPFLTSHTANAAYTTERARLMTIYMGEEAAPTAGHLPYYNTGFFGLAADAPHWDDFREFLTGFAAERYHFLTEQIAFNIACFRRRTTTLFPAVCNWMCYMAPPIRGEDGLWRSPVWPHPVIELLHLSGTDKMERYRPMGLLYDEGRYLDEIGDLIG